MFSLWFCICPHTRGLMLSASKESIKILSFKSCTWRKINELLKPDIHGMVHKIRYWRAQHVVEQINLFPIMQSALQIPIHRDSLFLSLYREKITLHILAPWDCRTNTWRFVLHGVSLKLQKIVFDVVLLYLVTDFGVFHLSLKIWHLN